MAKPKSTRKIGTLIIQERNLVCPDGAKTWLVLDGTKVVYSSMIKSEAIAWAKSQRQ